MKRGRKVLSTQEFRRRHAEIIELLADQSLKLTEIADIAGCETGDVCRIGHDRRSGVAMTRKVGSPTKSAQEFRETHKDLLSWLGDPKLSVIQIAKFTGHSRAYLYQIIADTRSGLTNRHPRKAVTQ